MDNDGDLDAFIGNCPDTAFIPEENADELWLNNVRSSHAHRF